MLLGEETSRNHQAHKKIINHIRKNLNLPASEKIASMSVLIGRFQSS